MTDEALLKVIHANPGLLAHAQATFAAAAAASAASAVPSVATHTATTAAAASLLQPQSPDVDSSDPSHESEEGSEAVHAGHWHARAIAARHARRVQSASMRTPRSNACLTFGSHLRACPACVLCLAPTLSRTASPLLTSEVDVDTKKGVVRVRMYEKSAAKVKGAKIHKGIANLVTEVLVKHRNPHCPVEPRPTTSTGSQSTLNANAQANASAPMPYFNMNEPIESEVNELALASLRSMFTSELINLTVPHGVTKPTGQALEDAIKHKYHRARIRFQDMSKGKLERQQTAATYVSQRRRVSAACTHSCASSTRENARLLHAAERCSTRLSSCLRPRVPSLRTYSKAICYAMWHSSASIWSRRRYGATATGRRRPWIC